MGLRLLSNELPDFRFFIAAKFLVMGFCTRCGLCVAAILHIGLVKAVLDGVAPVEDFLFDIFRLHIGAGSSGLGIKLVCDIFKGFKKCRVDGGRCVKAMTVIGVGRFV